MSVRFRTYILRRWLRIVGFVTGTVAVVLAIVFVAAKVFVVRNIVVNAPGMNIQIDEKSIGQSLVLLQTDSLRDDLLSAYPLLESVTFEKQLPDTLRITLVRKRAVAALESGGAYFAVDSEGVVVDVLSGPGEYPRLRIPVGTINVGSTVTDSRVRAALSFLKYAGNLPKPDVITLESDTVLSIAVGKSRIFIPQSADMDDKAATLQIILEGFRIKSILPSVIDLRFDKPIITN